MSQNNKLAPYRGNVPQMPEATSRRVVAQYNRHTERIVADTAIAMAGAAALSEIETQAAWNLVEAATFTDRLMHCTFDDSEIADVVRKAQHRLFGTYVGRLAQVTDVANIKVIQEVDQATGKIQQETWADRWEDRGARLSDVFGGRPRRLELPSGNR